MKHLIHGEIQAKIESRFLARANPPPVLFRYRRPSSYTIEELSKHQIYAALPAELNDPFECRTPVVWNRALIKQDFIEHAPVFGISPTEAADEFDSSVEWGMKNLLEKWESTTSQTRVVCFSAKSNSI